MRTATIITVGCKVNQYDSEAMAEILKDDGYDIVPYSADHPADVYIINTCSVTNTSDGKSRQMIRRAASVNSDAVIVVAGCYSQVSTKDIINIEGVDIVLGTRRRDRVAIYIKEFLETGKRIIDVSENEDHLSDISMERFSVQGHEGHTRAYIKIEDGCGCFCSYCIVPYARGPVRSRTPSDIAEEVGKLAFSGFKEIVVTGINLAAYGSDWNNINTTYRNDDIIPSLVVVLKKINEFKEIQRIRLGSLEPEAITSDFVSGIKNTGKLCPHFHMPLQSGCNETLKRMNRKYTSEEYREKVELLRSNFEDCAISTDIMVGFPGETDSEFETTLKFVEEISFSRTHIFKYSRRAGTAAAEMTDQIPNPVKDLRSESLIGLSAEKSLVFHESLVGRIMPILVEDSISDGLFAGLTANYVPVEFMGENVPSGEIADIELIKAFPDHIEGRTAFHNS